MDEQYSPRSPLNFKDINEHLEPASTNNFRDHQTSRRPIMLALPYITTLFCVKRRRDTPLNRSQSLASYLITGNDAYNEQGKKKKRQMAEWHAKGGFNLLNKNEGNKFMARCITDTSIARLLGVEAGLEITYMVTKKRPAIVSIPDLEEGRNLKRNKVSEAPLLIRDTSHHADVGITNMEVRTSEEQVNVVTPKQPPTITAAG